MRSVVAVPAKSSLIIEAYLTDDISRRDILCEDCEFSVPRDGRSLIGFIRSKDFSLKLTVKWKLPYSPAPSSANSSVSRLVKVKSMLYICQIE